MPTYSYRCTECERVFDAFHSMTCTEKQHCPECGMEGKKLMSASSVIFKGSGFYSTDYRDSGYLEAQKQETEQINKKADTSEKSSESSEKASTATSKETKKETPKAKSKIDKQAVA